MKKQEYLKPSIEIVELAVDSMIADSMNMGDPNDNLGGNAPGLSFDPVSGVSIDMGINLME